MRALLQRVSQASVTVGGQVVGQIGGGFLILLGIGQGDGEAQIKQLSDKIVHLRVFADEDGKMNRSLLDSGGQALVVSQFTLYADMHKGRRPSFIGAAAPTLADPPCRTLQRGYRGARHCCRRRHVWGAYACRVSE
ncbi:MAG: hypothetical protein PVS3B3_14240 [Ktedonobacteraceae bacterium]